MGPTGPKWPQQGRNESPSMAPQWKGRKKKKRKRKKKEKKKLKSNLLWELMGEGGHGGGGICGLGI